MVEVLTLAIDNRVRIGEGLPDELWDQIRRAFTYDNPDYAKALVFGFYKRVPRYIASWQDRTDAAGPGGLSVPRGGLERVEAILRAAGMAYFVEDHTTSGARVKIPASNVVPYDYQDRLIDAAMAKFKLVDSVAMWRSVQACVAGDTQIGLNRGGKSYNLEIADVVHRFNGGSAGNKYWDPLIDTYVRGRDAEGSVRLLRVIDALSTGKRDVRRVITAGGLSLETTDDHLFLTRRGWKPLKALRVGDDISVEGAPVEVGVDRVRRRYVQGLDWHPYAARQNDDAMLVLRHRLVMESILNRLDFDDYVARLRAGKVEGLYFIPPELSVHHIDENGKNNDPSNLALMTAKAHRAWHGLTQWRHVNASTIWDPIRSVGDRRLTDTYDLVLEDPHCYLANRIVVHNSGKTTAALILATKMQLKTLVIISNGVLMRQWCDRVKTELGFAPGVVGGGKYDVSPPIVVAMQQSMPKMPKEDVDRFGLLIGDEIQLFAANTFQASVDRFPARCRLGVSGDERRADGKECLVYDQFGSVTAEVLASELVASGRIHEVEVRIVPTSFRSDWWTAIDSMPPRPGEEMAKTIQRRVQAKIRQAERLAAELGADETRNATIVQLAQESVDQTGQALVLSTRREHCHVLDAALTSVGLKSGLLIGGADYRDEFARTLRAFVARSIQVAVGTYQAIGVGFDLPAVARGICAAPVANSPGGDKQWRQYRGRFARTTGGKSDAAIYYLWDQHVFGLKTLRHLVRWNARVVVRDGDDWIPAKQWLERSVADGPKKKRHSDDKQSQQRVIPGFDTDPERGRSALPHRRTRSAVRSDDDSPTDPERGRSVGVPTGRRTRTQAGGRG